jgi:hypothetical protein
MDKILRIASPQGDRCFGWALFLRCWAERAAGRALDLFVQAGYPEGIPPGSAVAQPSSMSWR